MAKSRHNTEALSGALAVSSTGPQAALPPWCPRRPC